MSRRGPGGLTTGPPADVASDDVGAPMTFDAGYPASSEADLDPGSQLAESLEDADRDAGNEHRFTPDGRRPDGSIEDEERFEDADQVDDPDSHRQLAGGRD